MCLLTRRDFIGLYTNRPATAREEIKFVLNQGRLELNSGIWDDVQVQRSKRSAVLTPLPLYYS